MEEAKRKIVIIVGVPGVGKSTLITKATEMLLKDGTIVNTVVFGTVMFDEAKKLGIDDRDKVRNLSVDDQQKLQAMAVDYILSLNGSVIIVDTHLFIKTLSGYYPGLPMNLILKLKPDKLILISADSKEIVERRKKDDTRSRDMISLSEVKRDLSISLSMISSLSILTGAPFEIIYNHYNMLDSAVSTMVKLLRRC